MKYTLFLLSLTSLVLSACSNGKVDSSANADSAGIDSVVSTNEVAYDPKEVINLEVQEMLRSFITDFEVAKVTLPKVEYKERFEYDGNDYAYYFEDGRLVYMTWENTAEGGYQQNITIKREETGDVILKTSTDGGSSFTCMYRGVRSGFIVTFGNEPSITGTTEPYSENYSTEMIKHFKGISDNKENFRRTEKVYEFYLERKMVDSDYGKVEISKVFKVDEPLFGMDLSKLAAENIPDPALLKPFMGTWYPLYANGSTYERHIMCGHESSIIVGEREGKITWLEQNLQDAWQATITSILKKENETYEMSLSYYENQTKRMLIIDEAREILFVDGRPYTNTRERYLVINSNNACEEGY